ncbi:hypothetical protein D3870_00505 [Noviherbaspirillum cavernae]|uniref:Uncharacterized protein n=1 Tax=Noviherbaspirillum cavernae TaxID=2320862 RepID=A0A418WWW7_9BURK|nr:hypothetical protein D3870_00505 [Noviherbaspirillum cavernae]
MKPYSGIAFHSFDDQDKHPCLAAPPRGMTRSGILTGVPTPNLNGLLGLVRLYGRTHGMYPQQSEALHPHAIALAKPAAVVQIGATGTALITRAAGTPAAAGITGRHRRWRRGSDRLLHGRRRGWRGNPDRRRRRHCRAFDILWNRASRSDRLVRCRLFLLHLLAPAFRRILFLGVRMRACNCLKHENHAGEHPDEWHEARNHVDALHHHDHWTAPLAACSISFFQSGKASRSRLPRRRPQILNQRA